jgi:phosphoribosylformylglycinamidine synthase
MSEPRALILTGLGLNCEAETEAAFAMAGARPDKVHLLDLLDGTAARKLADYPLLAFIGGFAFGDHLGAGSVFANKIRWRLYDDLLAFIEKGGLAIGICNGFQTMVRLGLLPGLDREFRTPRATLAPNDRVGYRDAWVTIGFDPASPCVWTRGLTSMELPSRHGEGKFVTTEAMGRRLEDEHLIVARYLDASGRPTTAWPDNPNGSAGGVAGICDPSGRLFGLMPHPDAYLYPFHHPQWSKRKLSGTAGVEGEGMRLFRNGVVAARS